MGFLQCFAYLAGVGTLSFFIGRILPGKWFRSEAFPYRCYEWEKKFYQCLRIRKWHNKLPDMSRLFPRLMPEKRLREDYPEKLPVLIRETCIAELIHVLLCIAGFVCVRIWKGKGGWIMSILFCLGNLPFIMIQRYNRPRLERIYMRCQKQEEV